jgi:nanoRNase/pAp phosphatase (c-di-AMP/oligoRNAs hydrolase)
MTTFVDACLTAMTDSTVAVEKHERVRPKVGKLLKALAGKTNIVITSHLHPDPDALGSCQAMQTLLGALRPDAKVTIRLQGQVGGGINDGFTRISRMDYLPWDASLPNDFDALVLVDTQAGFANCALPEGVQPTAVVDHHRGRGRRAKAAFTDVRINVGATASILFSYFMEAKIAISPELAATMLYAIESDLSGIAGQQGGLDTIAISSLTLLADTKRLYQMRYVDLPPGYYGAFAETVKQATRYGEVLVAHLDHVDFAETPGVMSDFLLRCRDINWTMVTALHNGRFVFSIRTKVANRSAGEVARGISDGLGDGGGHLTKAGGAIPVVDPSPGDLDALRVRLGRRLLRCLKVPLTKGTKLA